MLAASLETHLLGCADCRARLGLGQPTDTELAWDRLADAIDRPSRSSLARCARPSRRPPLVQAALVAVLLVGLVPLVTATAFGDAGLVALLVLAPLAPVAAVALAYRDGSDPAGEISLATPSAGLRLVALRALLVAAVALPLAFLRRCSPSTAGSSDVPMRLAVRLVPARPGAGRAGAAGRHHPDRPGAGGGRRQRRLGAARRRPP